MRRLHQRWKHRNLAIVFSSSSQRILSNRPILWGGALDLQLLVKNSFRAFAVLKVVEVWVVCELEMYAATREISNNVLERPFDEIFVLHTRNIQQALSFRKWSPKQLAELFLHVSQRRLTANRQRPHITLELEEEYYEHLRKRAQGDAKHVDCSAYN